MIAHLGKLLKEVRTQNVGSLEQASSRDDGDFDGWQWTRIDFPSDRVTVSSLSKQKEIPGFKANKAVIENIFSMKEFEWRMTPPKLEQNNLQV